MQSPDADQEPGRSGPGNNRPPRPWVVGLTVALLIVIGWGAWAALTPADVPASKQSVSYALKATVDTPGADPSADAARRRNLQQQAQQPNPFVTAIREAVGPKMSEDKLQELSREVNLLICGGTSSAEAVTHLTETGLARKTAEAVIAAVGSC